MVNLNLIKPNTLPRDEEYLWMYSDIHKFLNLIKQKRFRYSRMDQFEDPLEGVPFEYLYQFVLKNRIPEFNLASVILNQNNLLHLSGTKLFGRLDNILKIQATHFVSCWFYEQRESLAMWNLYSNEDGVAIKIPFGKMKSFLLPNIKEEWIKEYYCGKVNYQDFRNENPYSNENLTKIGKVALRKDTSFSHEKEIRFVVKVKDIKNNNTGITSNQLKLNDLDLKVVCHPKMTAWKMKNIKQILNDAKLSASYEVSKIILRG